MTADPPSIDRALAFVNTALAQSQETISALTRARIALELLADFEAIDAAAEAEQRCEVTP